MSTTLKGKKWLLNISIHAKRQKENMSMVTNRAAASLRDTENMCHVKKTSFYLMGAAAVMHPCGPHLIIEQTSGRHLLGAQIIAAALNKPLWHYSIRHGNTVPKNREREREGKRKKKKKGSIRGGEHGLGLQSNEHISMEPSTDSQFENGFLS